jgi:hypothetical protein
MPMVLQAQVIRDGRLRARFRPGKWQLSNRVPRNLRDYGEHTLTRSYDKAVQPPGPPPPKAID